MSLHAAGRRGHVIISFCVQEKMPKTTAKCLSLLLEDEAMVSADAVARASIDAGDQRRLSADPFPYCCSSTLLPSGVEEEPINDSTVSLNENKLHIDLNNNNLNIPEECEEHEWLSPPSTPEDVQDDTQSAEVAQSADCAQEILHWLEKRLKLGFTMEERGAYVR